MSNLITIKLISGIDAAPLVDPFYEQEGKTHRAQNSDLFFVAFLKNRVVGTCRFCIEEDTPLLRSMIIHQPVRSQKIGSKILKSFAQYLDSHNYKSVYCIPYTHLGNFYGLINFKIINEEEAPPFLQERIQKYRHNTTDKFMMMKRD